MKNQVVLLTVMSVLNVLTHGSLPFDILVSTAGCMAGVWYLPSNLMVHRSIWERARVVHICTCVCAVFTFLRGCVYVFIMVALSFNTAWDEEEEAEYNETLKELVVLFVLLLLWDTGFFALSVSVASKARHVMKLSDPVSSGITQL